MRVMRSASSPRPVYLRLVILLGCQVTHHIETLSRQKKNRAGFQAFGGRVFSAFRSYVIQRIDRPLGGQFAEKATQPAQSFSGR